MVKHHVESKKDNLAYRFLKPEYPSKPTVASAGQLFIRLDFKPKLQTGVIDMTT